MICLHDIFWYFFQRHKCQRALGFILEVMMSTRLIFLVSFGDTNALKSIFTHTVHTKVVDRGCLLYGFFRTI